MNSSRLLKYQPNRGLRVCQGLALTGSRTVASVSAATTTAAGWPLRSSFFPGLQLISREDGLQLGRGFLLERLDLRLLVGRQIQLVAKERRDQANDTRARWSTGSGRGRRRRVRGVLLGQGCTAQTPTDDAKGKNEKKKRAHEMLLSVLRRRRPINEAGPFRKTRREVDYTRHATVTLRIELQTSIYHSFVTDF